MLSRRRELHDCDLAAVNGIRIEAEQSRMRKALVEDARTNGVIPFFIGITGKHSE